MRRRQSVAMVLVGKSILHREGLAKILRSANFRILASASCASDLLQSKLQARRLLFLIIHTGDDFGAVVEQVEILRTLQPAGRIAVMADRFRLSESVAAYRAGAHGYFLDVMSCDVFTKSIELVTMGETVFPPAILASVLDSENSRASQAELCQDHDEAIVLSAEDAIAPQLSPRETSILRCLIEGDSNKCIARKIDIAEATVKVHVKAILRKIRVQNRTQAAIWGMSNGSLARPTSGSALPAIPGVSKPLPKPIEAISEVNQIESSPPLSAIGQGADCPEGPSIDNLIRRGMNRRTRSTVRLRK
jgi:DNA-binding NarL/FixJ family response regulator